MRKPGLWTLLLAFLVASVQAGASDRWLDKRHADKLYAHVDVVDCPLTTEELTGQVHEMLIRSRIKPLTKWDSGDIVLYLRVDCVATSDGGWLFRVTTKLAELRESRGDVIIAYREQDDFSLYGKGTEATLRRNIMQTAEDAFSKYLKANFDLEPE